MEKTPGAPGKSISGVDKQPSNPLAGKTIVAGKIVPLPSTQPATPAPKPTPTPLKPASILEEEQQSRRGGGGGEPEETPPPPPPPGLLVGLGGGFGMPGETLAATLADEAEERFRLGGERGLPLQPGTVETGQPRFVPGPSSFYEPSGPAGRTPSVLDGLSGTPGVALLGRDTEPPWRPPQVVSMPDGRRGVFRPSPYGKSEDIPVPDTGEQNKNPTPDAPLGRGLGHLPGGHPFKNPPFKDPSTNVDYYAALYAEFRWTARFTVDGYVISDLVDISGALEVFQEGNHIAAKFNHGKLQSALNAAGQFHASEMPISVRGGNVFFNDLDDLGMELRDQPVSTASMGGSGGRPKVNPRNEAEKFWKKRRERLRIPVRYVWPQKRNPVPKERQPKDPPKPPKPISGT